MRRLWTATVIVAGIFVGPHLALAQVAARGQDPAKAFAAAENAYERGRYKLVIKRLRPLLYPENHLATKSVFIRAHKMLGISYAFEKNNVAAEQSFLAILAERPDFRLDASVEPAAAVKLLERVRQRSARMLAKLRQAQKADDARKLAAEKTRLAELARLQREAKKRRNLVDRTIQKHNYWLNFMPFGTGQFQNSQRTKAYILMGVEVGLGTASLGLALAHRIEYPGGRVTAAQEASANGIKTAQVVTGVLFWAVVAYGIIDALANYRPSTVIERRHPQPPPGQPKRAERPGVTGLHFRF